MDHIMNSQESLKKLRAPFADNQISKLPKPTKAQTDALKANFTVGVRCQICGGWHHPQVIHLDYVGHAALTDRLLETDPAWTWEPLALDQMGYPAIDKDGGMWIKLTVCGVTRLGYGDAQGKTGGDAMKERIGDALRNAAMRFGAALDLWHKGDLHMPESGKDEVEQRGAIANPIATELPIYPDESFRKNKEVWKGLVDSGKKTVEAIITNVETKAILTDEQKNIINSWSKQQ
jgi:hypothetical protein